MAYLPQKPTEEEYQALVEEFWWGTTYAAKSLWRNELVFAKSFMFEYEIRLEVLIPLLRWRIELDHDWSLLLGIHGRGLERWLPTGTWDDLADTYVGPRIEENWTALFRIITLFRRVAAEVGEALGYPYPQHLDDRVSAYLNTVRDLPPE
jgi:aminoglycoside 6-adenylyltransferase